ncbi:MAG: regulatory signaling modulator protein AmpE [Pseudomonadota bacterium]
MKLIALLLAIVLERLATHLFRLRELRWLDRLIDPCLRLPQKFPAIPLVAISALLLLLFVLPVLILRFSIGESLLGIPYVALSVFVLFFSLGPQDIGEEVDAWCQAIESGDEEAAIERSKALLECDPRPNSRISEAIFIQGNNRIFAVVFWFVVLGPVGAWAVRVADIIRRRALFSIQDLPADELAPPNLAGSSEFVHALLAWLPARLSALGYTLAGSFEHGRAAWRVPLADDEGGDLGDRNDQLLSRVGEAALAFSSRVDETQAQAQVRNAQEAKRLVFRTVVFGLVTVAALTLLGPAI